ncbi:MAG: hypothetical protein LBP40_03165 [Campylobacteraceae bacterium]|jgi:hypothetical protein|nr:hypothetical protein [Campylobacteraceae bacterium]
MKKLLMIVALCAFFVGCGGGGSSNNNPSGAEEAFYSMFVDFNKPHKNVIYITGYDGLLNSEASNFLNSLNAKAFTCTYAANSGKCEKYNLPLNVLYALGETQDSAGALNVGYVIG